MEQLWAQTATEETPVMGIKGPTAISIYMADFIEGMAIDRMHGVDGGIIKKILTLLFDVQYRDEGFSLYDRIDTVNNRLMSIKTTKFIHRSTRTITEVIHWKASKLRVWAYYYSLPVLDGILRQDLFENYKLLIGACAILSFNEITEVLLNVTEDFLNKFVKDFEELYGLRFCSINLHQLLHLPNCVRRLGTLWSAQCFKYENINGLTLRSIKGTDHVDTQDESSHIRTMQHVRYTETLPEGKIKDFCLNRKKQAKIIERIGLKTYSIGTYKNMDERPNNLRRLLGNANIDENAKLYQYFRMLKNRKLIVSTMYPKELQTQSNAVCYSDRDRTYLGFVDYFIKVKRCNCEELICLCNGNLYALIQQILTDEVFEVTGETYTFNTLRYLHKCHVNDTYFLIPVENIDDVCVVINFDDKMYIGIPLNKYELE